LYVSPNVVMEIKSRRMSWTGHVADVGDRGNAYKILVGKPERERQLGRHREHNIKMDLDEI